MVHQILRKGDEGPRIWKKDVPEFPKCGIADRTKCDYPNNLERRENAEIFEKRYNLYLEKEYPVFEFLENAYPTTNIEMVGGYRDMVEEVLFHTVKMLEIEFEKADERINIGGIYLNLVVLKYACSGGLGEACAIFKGSLDPRTTGTCPKTKYVGQS